MHKLITIAFSHFNEKARFALDRFGIEYQDHRYLPAFHMAPVSKATWKTGSGRADRVSSRFSTPVLITDDGRVIADSAEIARYASDHASDSSRGLYPVDEARELEDYFHDNLAAHTRRLAYFYMLQDQKAAHAIARANVSRRQAALHRLSAPVVNPMLRRAMGLDSSGAARSQKKVRKVFSEVSEKVDGRNYLVADQFTAADLSFACLASPVLLTTRQEGFSATLPHVDSVVPEYRNLVKELRETPAGRYALRILREERAVAP